MKHDFIFNGLFSASSSFFVFSIQFFKTVDGKLNLQMTAFGLEISGVVSNCSTN